MGSTQPDILLINPDGRGQAYQNLANELSAVEPPVWVGLLATNVRNAGYSAEILDAEGEGLNPQDVARRVAQIKPLLAATVVFGANPSASTQNMTTAGAICSAIREAALDVKQMLCGLHVSALPERTLREETVDFTCQGEGPHTIRPLLAKLRAGSEDYSDIPGLWYFKDGQVVSNAPAPLIRDLDAELPGVAWDLLPMDKYRAHNWHCFDDIDHRSPYAVIYASLGCPFSCDFCCINALFGASSIRYRSIEQVVGEIDLLVRQYNVKNIKILDELFVLKRDRVEQFCDMLIERDYDLNLWAYARVDTVEPKILKKLRRAGVRWLAYGFESASQRVRDDVSKRFAAETVDSAIRWTRQAGIYIIANYIVGLPDDDHDTMQQTLDEAVRHNFEYLNIYCAMAYPGSKLYDQAVAEGWPLPDSWHGYSQLGAETLPLPTRHLTSAEVLNFRDRAFCEYHSRPEYLRMIHDKFGPKVVEHIRKMLEQEIERKYS
ncbi:MAG: cobalamin-dependent protein [Phycisphaerae bacterium]|nr:cobalamin-dependent protein [Phycisphaerae bacterium]